MRPHRLLSLFFLLAAGLVAQEFQGTNLGRITDSTGAAVPDVQVRAVAAETGASSTTKTNLQGNYRIPFLLPGDYRVLIEHPGFQKIERQNVRVSMATETTLDCVLQVSASSESVTVSAALSALNTSNGELGQVVERAYIENVPISLTRNVLNNISLDAAVDASGGSYTSNGQSGISIAGGGATSGNNEVIVDGVPNTIARSGGIIIYVPTAYSVDEMKVHTTMGRNVSLAKDMRLWERYKLQIRCEATNFTNSVSWGNPGVNMSNQATFGVISSGGGGRSIQMSARVIF